MVKKSQAAMEFLMTYGWAILVVLVAIGALAYFGVLSPDKFLPSKCTLPSGIACLDFTVTPILMEIRIQNGLGYDMSAISVSTADCGSINTPATLANGEAATYAITCPTPLVGTKYNGEINVTYTLTETGLTHTKGGSLTAKIE